MACFLSSSNGSCSTQSSANAVIENMPKHKSKARKSFIIIQDLNAEDKNSVTKKDARRITKSKNF
jgi:calcineurin-like phosphoesterase